MFHIVVYSVPVRVESGICVRIEVDDVYTGNLPELIDVDMVVGDFSSGRLDEEVVVTPAVGSFPYLLHGLIGSTAAVAFVVKGCAFASYHVQQDAETGLVIGYMRDASPVL